MSLLYYDQHQLVWMCKRQKSERLQLYSFSISDTMTVIYVYNIFPFFKWVAYEFTRSQQHSFQQLPWLQRYYVTVYQNITLNCVCKKRYISIYYYYYYKYSLRQLIYFHFSKTKINDFIYDFVHRANNCSEHLGSFMDNNHKYKY